LDTTVDDASAKPPIMLGKAPQEPPERKLKGHKPEEESTDDAQRQIPVAMKVDKELPKSPIAQSSQFVLRQLPIDLRSVQVTWQRFRSVTLDGQSREVDLERTLAQVMRTGALNDVILRSTLKRRGDLLLLVDDDTPMLPFRPAIKPLLDAIADRRIHPALVYQFTTYPMEYFYKWQRPQDAVAISTVLTRVHRQRTTVMIVSDAGAASRSYNPVRLQRTGQFLSRLLPCVRDVLWLNPLPQSRWAGTSASAVAQALQGRMVALDEFCSQRREMTREEVHLWSLVM
jgi:uncharacterized protein